jgi:phosphatidylglycerol:prolipoprotein diacylglycerol transferase
MLTVGPLTFHLYGLLVGLGVLLGVRASVRAAELVKIEADEVWNGLLWAGGGGIIGARLYHVVDLWQYYSLHPGEILALWHGGMGIFGAILGGIIGLWFYAKKKDKLVKLLDVGAVGLPLGQAIGRWGNFFNQELYGKPTDLAWGIYIKPENRLLSVMGYEKFQPLFLYESILSLLIFLILWWLVKDKKVKVGESGLFITYLGLYGLGRFFLEFLRIESWRIAGINVAQGISLGLVLLAVGWWGRKGYVSLTEKN